MTQPSPGQHEQPAQKRKHLHLDDMLRHPLAAIIIGFLLTGVVGTTLSNQLAEQRRREADADHLSDTRREVIRGFSRLLSERVMRMQMLIIGIERHSSPQALTEIKRLYDETEAKFVMERPGIILLAREILGESDYQLWRTELDVRLRKKRLVPLRDCLEQAYTTASTQGDGVAVLKDGQATRLLQESSACGELFVDALYDLSLIAKLDPSNPKVAKARDLFRRQIEQICP